MSSCRATNANPEIGGMVGGVPTWIKLYLRKEPLSYDRMILMLAVLQRGLDIARGRGLPIEARQVAVFDVRQGAICTPTLNEAVAARVASYTKLVTAEGVGYGVLRSLAEKELVAKDEREREARAAESRDEAPAVREDAGSGEDDDGADENDES